MSDMAVFWIALIGSTAWGVSARTRTGDGLYVLLQRITDGLASWAALIVAIVYLFKAVLP